MANKESQPDRELWVAQESGHQVLDTAVCRGCHCVHRNRRWLLDERLYRELREQPGVSQILCPACHAIQEDKPEGVVVVVGRLSDQVHDEVLNLVRNEEKLAHQRNPLARIARITEHQQQMQIETTTPVLAHRLGQAVEHAVHGRLSIQWLPGDRFVRLTVAV